MVVYHWRVVLVSIRFYSGVKNFMMEMVGEDFFSTLAVGDGIALVFARFCMYEQLETLDLSRFGISSA